MLENNRSENCIEYSHGLPHCEHVLLDSFRTLSAARISGNDQYVFVARDLLAEFAGAEVGVKLYHHVVNYMKSLEACTSNPLRVYAKSCAYICRDEALLLSLIAGLQNNNKTTSVLCIDSLCCQLCKNRVREEAETLADYLISINKPLIPVPANVIRDILTRDISSPTLQ